MYRMLQVVSRRLDLANRRDIGRTRAGPGRRARAAQEGESERPFPPGDYDVVVVGSGPGGLQTSYYLTRFGIDHAVISADPSPGGMFRRFPFFQRLLSWTKPYAQLAHDSREYERYDWNSLIAFEPENRAVMPPLMDGSSEFPSRPEMEQGLRPLRGAHRPARPVRDALGEHRRPTGSASSSTPRTATTVRRVSSSRSAPPSRACPRRPASSSPPTTPTPGPRSRTRASASSSSASRTPASSWRPACSSGPAPSSSPRRKAAQLSVNLHSLDGVRARYIQPWEDAQLGGGVFILNASIERLERSERRDHRAHAPLRQTAPPFAVEVDEVIAASGFTSPLRDLEALGVSTFGRSGWPSLTNAYESATVPGIWFAGTITQAVGGIKKYGIPANSGAVHGHRYNNRLLVESVVQRLTGRVPERPEVDPERVVDLLLEAVSTAPELWHQKSYLARAISRDPDGRVRDEGIVSLAEYVDVAGPDGVAITVETDATGDIHPAVYVRQRGRVDTDNVLEHEPLHDFRTDGHRSQLRDMIDGVLRGS